MSGSTVTGNIGISNQAGVIISAVPILSGPMSMAISDSSGNFTLSLAAGGYVLTADTRNITSGAYLGFVYRQVLQITVDGSTSLSGVNFIPPVNPNTANPQT